MHAVTACRSIALQCLHNEELYGHTWKGCTICGLAIAILSFLSGNMNQVQPHVAESFHSHFVTHELSYPASSYLASSYLVSSYLVSSYLACTYGAGGVHDKPDVGHAA